MNLNKNNQESLRKFHIDGLPRKELYFLLDASFRKKFFERLYLLIGGSTVLGRKLSVNNETIRRWKVGKRAMPNWALLDLNNLLKNKGFSIKEIEGNIVAYRGESSKKPIIKPKLPIVEDKRLIRIVTHLLCDGYDGGKRHLPVYNNTEKVLIDLFINDLTVFGDVPYRIREHDNNWKSNRRLYRVEFPRIFTHILRHIYKINFKGEKGRLPKPFFSLPNVLSRYCIQACADDESYVSDTKIHLGLKNYNLVKDFRELVINILDLKQGDTTLVKPTMTEGIYYFELNRSGINKYFKIINFNHPKKKKLLHSIVKRSTTLGNKYPKGVAKEKILEILKNKPSTRRELSLKLGIKSKNIYFHLENLKKTNNVTVSGTGHYGAEIWSLVK